MERQQGHNERSLAWFKLADLIARGEREKALSVFRLLAHSLSDKAYVLQIEGDILWFMDSAASIEKYKQAAFLYQKEKRWTDAIAIQEHVYTMRPDAFDPLATLLVLYALVDWPEKFDHRFMNMMQLYKEHAIDNSQVEKAIQALGEILETQDKKPWISIWFTNVEEHLPALVTAKWRLFFKS
ncbi:hypothetical protein FJ365_00500 [Candidatus Dependentiae bacterium]|nr:hypothetical protein [Candidatus Dependentiae bacterium]